MELPLGGLDLSVRAAHSNSRVQTRLDMSLDQVAAKGIVGANATKILALRLRVAALGPAERPAVKVQNAVLLLEAEPRIVLPHALKDLRGLGPVVCGVGRLLTCVRLAQDEFVLALQVRVLENGKINSYINSNINNTTKKRF